MNLNQCTYIHFLFVSIKFLTMIFPAYIYTWDPQGGNFLEQEFVCLGHDRKFLMWTVASEEV